MRVLVAGDEEVLAGLVATGPRRAGFAVDTAYSGDAALAYPGCTTTTSSSWTAICRGSTGRRGAQAGRDRVPR